MQIENEYVSLLTMHELYIEKSNFRREKDIRDGVIIPQFSRVLRKLGDGKYELTFDAVLKEEKEKLFLEVVCKSSFSIDGELHNNLIEKNALAIIFPYVRSYISTMTCQPGMMPIVLPPMNINSMLEKNEIRSE